MKSFDFIYDFASPNVYLMHKIMGQIEDRSGAKARYVPVLLGGIFRLTENTPPLVQFKDVKGKIEYNRRVMARFIEKYDIPFQFNPHFPVMTTPVMRGAIFAQDKDYYGQYLDLCFDAVWQHQLNMGDLEVIEDAASRSRPACGAPPATTRKREGLFATTQAAVDRGAFGAPMMFVGDEPFFGKDSLDEMIEWIVNHG